jgi:cation transport ATPase
LEATIVTSSVRTALRAAAWPFSAGAWSELKARQPGMMLLIALA